jgi:hypothetical protein
MATVTRIAPDMFFDFDFYAFRGKGVKPSLVPTAEQANIMRSRTSVEGSLVDIATQRAVQWAREHGISIAVRKPYPSNQQGKYWLEFRFGGITL